MQPYFQLGASPEAPTLVLQCKSGESLGVLDGASNIIYKKNLNSANELSFTVCKYLDGRLNPLWNSLTDLKNVYLPEFKERFEIKVSCQEETMETKSITGTSLCEAELGQIILHGLEINTDQDLDRSSSESYPVTVFYRDIFDTDSPAVKKQKEKHSLLHRVLSDKASFYQIGHVDKSLKDLAYTFTADGTSVYDFLTGEVAKQMQCLFQFDSMTRKINVYALSDDDSTEGIGRDTAILIDRENLASSLTCEGDTDSLKNCFYVEGGDELINAAFTQLNPSGDQYLYYFSPETLADMPKPLQDAISEYNAKSENYLKLYPKKPSETTHQYQKRPDTGKSYMIEAAFNPSAPDSRYSAAFQTALAEISHLSDQSGKYPYIDYNYQVPQMYSSHTYLVTSYYNAMDFQSFLEFKMMPDYNIEVYDKYQALSRLNRQSFGDIGIASLHLSSPSKRSIENAITNKAKTLINTALFTVSIEDSQVSVTENSGNTSVTWSGTFSITDRQNDDPATGTVTNATYRAIAEKENYNLSALPSIPASITLTINDDVVSYAKNSIASILAKKDLPMAADFYSPDMTETEFSRRISLYGLSSLSIIQNVLTDCLGIVSEQLERIADSASIQNEMYQKLTNYQNSYKNKLSLTTQMTSKRERQIHDAETFVLLMEAYLTEVKNELDFKKYLVSYGSSHNLNQNLWEVFQYYRREGEYRNENIISAGLKDNASIVSHARKLMELAGKELETAGTMQYSISTAMDNLLALPEFAPVFEDFDIGNWIRVRMDIQDSLGKEQIYKLRLLSYQINYNETDASGIQVEFSTVIRGAGGLMSDVESILDSAQSMTKSYGATVRQVSIASDAAKVVDHWVADGLDLTNQQIINDAQNQSLVIDSNGLLARKQDPLTDTYDDCQLRIFHNGIYTTHDNWETMDAALGKFWYKDLNGSGQPAETYGVIARKLVGEQILGEELRFCNSSGTMEFADQGLTISNGVNTINFQPNTSADSEAPGRLFQITAQKTPSSAKDLLYTDTEGNLNITGNLLAEQISTNSGKFAVDSEGTLHASDAEISGKVTATAGSFTGTVNATGGEFSGNITCSGTIQGGTIQGSTIDAGVITGGIIQGTGISGGSIQGSTITGGTIQGTGISGGTITGGTIQGTGISGGTINVNDKFIVDGSGSLQATSAEITGNIDATSLKVHKSYYIYDADWNEEKVKIFTSVADNSSDTELRIGRLTKNAYNSPLNYISFHDLSQERSINFHSDLFEFSFGGSSESIFLFENELNSDSSYLRLSNENATVVVGEVSFRPSENDRDFLNLGHEHYPWKQVYAVNSSIKPSDRNLKEQICPISQKYETLFDLVEPVTYKLKSSAKATHDRIHIGAISQQVEAAMAEADLTSEELSFFCKNANSDGSGAQYALRYEEWIMLNTHMIQKTRRELQEATETIAMLQQEIAGLKTAIKNLQEVH